MRYVKSQSRLVVFDNRLATVGIEVFFTDQDQEKRKVGHPSGQILPNRLMICERKGEHLTISKKDFIN